MCIEQRSARLECFGLASCVFWYPVGLSPTLWRSHPGVLSAEMKRLGPVQLCSTLIDLWSTNNSSACHPAFVTLVSSAAMILP